MRQRSLHPRLKRFCDSFGKRLIDETLANKTFFSRANGREIGFDEYKEKVCEPIMQCIDRLPKSKRLHVYEHDL